MIFLIRKKKKNSKDLLLIFPCAYKYLKVLAYFVSIVFVLCFPIKFKELQVRLSAKLAQTFGILKLNANNTNTQNLLIFNE